MEKTKQKLLPLSSDIVFKRVFSREGTEDILKDFLEAILNIKIKKVEVKNPELPKNIYDEKAGVLDIKVEIDEQTICDVEMQVKDEYNVDKRSLKYAANLIEMQLKIGDQYTKLKKVIVINILKFNFYKRNGYHHIAHMKFEEINQNEYVDMGFIDDNSKELVDMAENKNETLKEARIEMNYLTGDAELRRLAELREKWEMDRINAINHATKVGRKERKRRTEKRKVPEKKA